VDGEEGRLMLAAAFWQHPIVIGIAVTVPSVVLGYLGYRRARQIDKVAAQAGIATSQNASIGQVVDGLNTIIANLQEDNRVLRQAIADLQTRITYLEKLVRESGTA
jgi:hypothetical protein